MTRFRTGKAAVLGLLVVLLAGCGRSDGRQTISGPVTFQGKPLDGVIEFLPAEKEPTQAILVFCGVPGSRLTDRSLP